LLLLFDIDGTLIRGAPRAHQQAMLAAVTEVYGVTFDGEENPVRAVVPNGKTDRQIVREMLLPRGVDDAAIDAGFERFERLSCEHHSLSRDAVLTEEESERTAAVLRTLAEDGHTLALLTGNLEPIARHKMDLAGLGDFFAPGLGGFGSDAEARPELVPIARRRAGRDGRDYPREDTVVIGDTPLDIAAAHADDVRAVGIAGFGYTSDDLLAAGADAVVDDLDELPAVVGELAAAS
jgi:phosphoglycolate phosphatase